MGGRERISDKDIAEWIKGVEDDTSPKEVASNPKPPEQALKPNEQRDIDPATRHLTATYDVPPSDEGLS